MSETPPWRSCAAASGGSPATQSLLPIIETFTAAAGNEYLLYLFAAMVGFNFGGNFALFPVFTAGTFGAKNIGQNYGWVFLAYGVAGIAGPQVAGYFKDAAKGGDVAAWFTPFIIAGIACIIAAAIGIALKPPQLAERGNG